MTSRKQFVSYRDCADCGKPLDDNRVRRCAECLLVNKLSAKKYREEHRKNILEKHQFSRIRLKDEVFNAYGGWICACCGETRKEFLSIDHINGGGNRQKKELKLGGGYSFYCWLKREGFPSGYRVLCMNCNFATRSGVICPHKTENRFVITESGMIGPNLGVLDPIKAATALGRICRFTGNGKAFFPVLLHSLVVSDLCADEYKFAGLIHDVGETAISDVPSPFKVPELKALEEKIILNMFQSLGLLATDLDAIKDADRRALIAEIWVYGRDDLKSFYTKRDLEAEKIVRHYLEKYPSHECVNSSGAGVVEFVKRFNSLKKEK